MFTRCGCSGEIMVVNGVLPLETVQMMTFRPHCVWLVSNRQPWSISCCLKSSMFPTGSPLHDVVANCYGNGLKVLKSILQRSHQAFVDEPATLVTTYPKQKKKSLLEYKMEAEDFLQMCSIVQGFSKDLDDPGELDIFINKIKYSTFV